MCPHIVVLQSSVGGIGPCCVVEFGRWDWSSHVAPHCCVTEFGGWDWSMLCCSLVGRTGPIMCPHIVLQSSVSGRGPCCVVEFGRWDWSVLCCRVWQMALVHIVL